MKMYKGKDVKEAKTYFDVKQLEENGYSRELPKKEKKVTTDKKKKSE